jgi:Zn-dependent peptidase ImmA (M78 family)
MLTSILTGALLFVQALPGGHLVTAIETSPVLPKGYDAIILHRRPTVITLRDDFILDEEGKYLLAHELGHIVWRTCRNKPAYPLARAPFVSHYAKTNYKEDAAETFAYMMEHDTTEKQFQKKFKLIQSCISSL